MDGKGAVICHSHAFIDFDLSGQNEEKLLSGIVSDLLKNITLGRTYKIMLTKDSRVVEESYIPHTSPIKIVTYNLYYKEEESKDGNSIG